MSLTKDSVSKSIHKTFKNAEREGGGRISFGTAGMVFWVSSIAQHPIVMCAESWVELSLNHRSLIAGAFAMQDRIRGRIMDSNYWKDAVSFRAKAFKDTDDLTSILVSAIERETQAMNRIMQEVGGVWLPAHVRSSTRLVATACIPVVRRSSRRRRSLNARCTRRSRRRKRSA